MGASRPEKDIAYGEQNVRPSAELKPAYGGQIIQLLVFEQTKKSEKRGSRQKKGPRPKIEIRFGHSYSRSHRVPTYQISSRTTSNKKVKKKRGLSPYPAKNN